MSQQPLWFNICNKENFQQAWSKVRSNLGAPGLDRVTISDFEQNLDENLSLLLETVKQGTYQPLPLLSFQIKKESGKLRELKIPTVRDRVVQVALQLPIQPILEKVFLDCSYAYRTGKSAQKAAERVMRNIKKGKQWIVDADIEGFFDNVDHNLVLKMLESHVADNKIIRIIELILKSGQSQEGKGIPQGGAISPMLANLYLHVLDEKMIKAKWNYIRYADDLVVLCQSEQEANTAFQRANQCLKQDLQLEFHKDKTKILHAKDGFVFLGYYFDLSGKRPSASSVEKVTKKIEKVLEKAETISDVQLKDKLESIIRGWSNYFQLDTTNKKQIFEEFLNKLKSQQESLPARLLTTALALHFGDTPKAQNLVENAPIQNTEDAELQYQWGVICELSDKQQEAIDSYHRVYRLQADHPDAAYRLGQHYLNQGQFERAIRFLQKAIQNSPDSAHAHFALATALKKFSLNGAAQKAFEKAFQLDPKLKRIKNVTQPQKVTAPPQSLPIANFEENDIQLFIQLFSAREGVYSRQWTDNTGRLGYNPVYKPLSKDVVKSHFQGKETLGMYILRTDNTVRHIIIDIDISRQARNETTDEEIVMDKWQEITHQDAVNIYSICQKLDIPVYIENSGFKGRHVWFFFSDPVPARDGIAFAKKILEETGEPPSGINREIFPKEARVSTKALGSMVKLPLGVHKLTERRCLLLEPSGQPWKNQFEVLNSIKQITQSQFHAAIERLNAGEIEGPSKNIDTSKAERMIEKCNVLKYLVNKVEKERHLAHIDRLTLLHTLGHLGEEGRYMLHKIISKTLNYDHRITQKWYLRLKGSPVSCPKIREWQNHITPSIGCYCPFPENSKCYPTPLLHADSNFKPKNRSSSNADSPKKDIPVAHEIPKQKPGSATQKEQPADHSISSSPQDEIIQIIPEIELEQLMEDYIGLKQKFRALDTEKQTLETKLKLVFDQRKCDKMEFKMGTLKRINQDNSIKWIIEI
ncbi:MAG: CRISPR-associated primase-polymerase type A1 [Candidatus Zhuqueibacterota bacterium]